MMKRYKRVLLLCLLAFSSFAFADAEIKVATWNIEHLRAENDTGAVKRTDADYKALADLAQNLNADIIALQEVDGPEAAARIFDPENYVFFFSNRSHTQRTGFAVRKHISAVAKDFVELALDDSVRRGMDILVTLDGQHLRLLSVHLKSGCFERALDAGSRACKKLARQLPVLEEWIDQRTTEGVPFVVLGDFNRRFDAAGDTFFPEIDDGDPAPLDLVRAIEGEESQCLGGRYPVYIDHIVLDEQAAQMLVPDSFEQIQITKADERQFALSDHCPIAVRLLIPTNDLPSEEEASEGPKEEGAAKKQEGDRQKASTEALI